MSTEITLEKLVWAIAKGLRDRLQELIPQFEVGINHQVESYRSENTFQWLTRPYAEISLIDPEDPYYPYQGGVGGPPECKFLPISIRLEPWSGLVKFGWGSTAATMHIENPKVFDWAVGIFMSAFKQLRPEIVIASQSASS